MESAMDMAAALITAEPLCCRLRIAYPRNTSRRLLRLTAVAGGVLTHGLKHIDDGYILALEHTRQD